MENTPAIHTALEFLKDNKYKPFKTAYFIRQNDSDMGDEDFCHECIKNELKRCKDDKKKNFVISNYLEKRIDKNDHEILTNGDTKTQDFKHSPEELFPNELLGQNQTHTFINNKMS
jgi:hypothetical protein